MLAWTEGAGLLGAVLRPGWTCVKPQEATATVARFPVAESKDVTLTETRGEAFRGLPGLICALVMIRAA